MSSAMREKATGSAAKNHKNLAKNLRATTKKKTKLSHRQLEQPASSETAISFPTGMELGFSVYLDENAQTVVTKVVRGGAADRAGCSVGAVLVRVDGKSIVSLPQEEVLRMIMHPPASLNMRTFGFLPPAELLSSSRQGTDSDWSVPAFKGELGRLHISQREKFESLMRPRSTFDIGDENPEAVYCA